MNDLGWNDLHTQLLNWTYSLYIEQFRRTAHLANLGYFGRPDPTLEKVKGVEKRIVTPDFIATDKKGIVQIHDIKGFERLSMTTEDYIKTKIEEKFQEIADYKNITSDSIKSYFKLRDLPLTNYDQEIVTIVDFDFYSRNSKIIKEIAKSYDLIVWSIDTKQHRLRKEIGQHLDKNLNAIFRGNKPLPIPPWCPPLVLFTRQTDKRLRVFHFISNLILALAYDSKASLKFSEIDKLMVESNPPKFGHLTLDERKKEWEALLYGAVEHHKVLKRSKIGPDIYELQNTAILENPYSRFKLLEDLRKNLGIVR